MRIEKISPISQSSFNSKKSSQNVRGKRNKKSKEFEEKIKKMVNSDKKQVAEETKHLPGIQLSNDINRVIQMKRLGLEEKER